MEYDFLAVSDGNGDAVLMHVMADRLVGSDTLDVDSVTNVAAKTIATAGTLQSDGKLDPDTITNFTCHTSGGNLIIDEFEPGSTDIGNTEGQIVIVKPNTGWTNRVATHVMNMTGNGTPENITVDDLAVSGDVDVTGGLDVGGNLAVTGQFRGKPRTSTTTSTATLTPNIDSYNVYELNAQAANLTIANPTGTPNDKDIIIIYLKDNGTSRTITYGGGYSNISGLDNLTATTIGKWHTLAMQYFASSTNWKIVSIATEA